MKRVWFGLVLLAMTSLSTFAQKNLELRKQPSSCAKNSSSAL
jgi:hypothetical protein